MITVVFTPSYQAILTRRCAFECTYCSFPHTPSPVPPSPKAFRTYLRTAQRLGAWEVMLTAGEGLDRMTEIQSTMRYYGFDGWYDYLGELCRLTLQARGRQPLTPVLDVGPIPTRALRSLSRYAPVIRILLDTVDPILGPVVHAQAPQKSPILRALALKDVGRVGIPLATGTRVGLGESPESWVQAMEIANEVQQEYGNITAFHLVPFVPQSRSLMEQTPPVATEIYKDAIATARKTLRKDIPLIAEVHHRFALAPEAVISGAFDLGPIRIASSERFDVDMLNSVKAVREVLKRVNVTMQSVPVLREDYVNKHRLPEIVTQNLQRFQGIHQKPGEDTPSGGTMVFGY